MHERINSTVGKLMMVLRKSSIEPVIGTLAHNNQIQLLWGYVVFFA